MSRSPGFVTWADLAVVAGAAAILSFAALDSLAVAYGTPATLGWLLPDLQRCGSGRGHSLSRNGRMSTAAPLRDPRHVCTITAAQRLPSSFVQLSDQPVHAALGQLHRHDHRVFGDRNDVRQTATFQPQLKFRPAILPMGIGCWPAAVSATLCRGIPVRQSLIPEVQMTTSAVLDSPTSSVPPPLPRAQRNVVFSTILLGMLLSALDQTIV